MSDMTPAIGPTGLPALEAQLARQLALTGFGGADWTRRREHRRRKQPGP